MSIYDKDKTMRVYGGIQSGRDACPGCTSNTHNFLTDQGAYVHLHITAEWEDVGGPESGPVIVGHEAFDIYSGDSHEFVVQDGLIVDQAVIDWDAVRFFELQDAQGSDDEIPY